MNLVLALCFNNFRIIVVIVQFFVVGVVCCVVKPLVSEFFKCVRCDNKTEIVVGSEQLNTTEDTIIHTKRINNFDVEFGAKLK